MANSTYNTNSSSSTRSEEQKRQTNQVSTEEILNRLDLVDLVSEFVRDLKKTPSGNYTGSCPFPDHNDSTPSFHVKIQSKNGHPYFKCYGCGRWGGTLTFLKEIYGLDKKGAFEEAKRRVGTIPINAADTSKNKPADKQKPGGKPIAEWQTEEWQNFAETQLTAAKNRMNQQQFKEFEKQRGLNQKTARHFEIGWTGETASKYSIKINGQNRFLMIPARCWVFPRRNAEGFIEQLKWRDPSKNKSGKYGQLTGSQAGIFNLETARNNEQNYKLLCTGEFETMLLWQFGFEAACHTGGEGATLDIDKYFGTDKPVFYIGDNDSAGKQAASRKQSDCPRLKICFPDPPNKDLTEQLLSGPGKLSKYDIERFLSQALGPQAKRHARGKTYRVEVESLGIGNDDDAIAQSENFVELEEARLQLALAASHFYHYPRKSRTSILQIQAQPGVGKGYAFNEEATRRSFNGDGTTIWLAPRKDMFSDQKRQPSDWKLIEGRKAAVDRDGNRVNFDDPGAVIPGNCTPEGEEYHRVMAEKKWELESHEYCKICPLKDRCESKGYYSKLKKDGRNAFANFKHMFTTIPQDYRFVVIDEPRFQDFVDIQKVDTVELNQIRFFTSNHGMDKVNRALGELMARPKVNAGDQKSAEHIVPGAGEVRYKPSWQLTGRPLYVELDAISREMFNGQGLLALIDQAEAAQGGWLRHQVFDLLEERTAEAAQKLPKNVWQPNGPNPAPGTGGIYDIIKEEARQILGGQLEFEFVSRLELVGPPIIKPGPAVLYLHRRLYLPAEVSKKPIAVLDATGDTNILRELLSYYENVQFGDREYRQSNPIWKLRTPNITTVKPVVELPVEVLVTQKSRRNYSKTSLLQSLKKADSEQRYWQSFLNDILLFMQKNEPTLITCCKALKPQLIEDLEKRGITSQSGYSFVVENYGNLRGSNAFKDYDCVIEAGMYGPQPEAIVAAGRALFGGDGNSLITERSRQRQLYPTRLLDGAAMADDVLVFDDPRLQTLMEQEQASEYLQVAYRIRPLATAPGRKKRLVLLFAQPVPGLPVHRLITEDEGSKNLEDLTNPRTLKIVEKLKTAAYEFIEEAKKKEVTPFFSAQMIAEKSGVSLTATYKYFEQLINAIGMQRQCYLFSEKMPNGKDREEKATRRRLRTLVFATPMGISQKEIHFIITFGEMPIPANWTDPRPEELNVIPELEQPIVLKPEEVSPEFQGEVSVRLAGLGLLVKEYQSVIQADNRFSARASIIREQHIEFNKQLNALVRRHAPRRRQQEVA